MTRFEKWSVWGTTALVAASGIGFGWTKYLTTSGDPFSVINHPLQPVFLKLHILVAPLFLFAIGMVAVRHIWKHFRSGTRWSRKSGITAGASLVPMVATGYLIQVLTGEGWLAAMAIAHIGLGLVYLVGMGLHGWFLAKPPPKGAGPGRRRRARPGAPRPVEAERPGGGAEDEAAAKPEAKPAAAAKPEPAAAERSRAPRTARGERPGGGSAARPHDGRRPATPTSTTTSTTGSDR